MQDRSLRRAQDVRKQLLTIMDRYKLDLVSAGRNFNKIRQVRGPGMCSAAECMLACPRWGSIRDVRLGCSSMACQDACWPAGERKQKQTGMMGGIGAPFPLHAGMHLRYH